jgi:hypothetical protein
MSMTAVMTGLYIRPLGARPEIMDSLTIGLLTAHKQSGNKMMVGRRLLEERVVGDGELA